MGLLLLPFIILVALGLFTLALALALDSPWLLPLFALVTLGGLCSLLPARPR